MGAVTLNNKVYLTGGYSYGLRNEILMFDNDKWSLVSHMIEGREDHAVSVISFDKDVENDCKDFNHVSTTTTAEATTTKTTTTTTTTTTATSPSKASTIVISCNILLL